MKDSELHLTRWSRVRSSLLALMVFLTPAANIFSLRALFLLCRLKSIAGIALSWWLGGAGVLGLLSAANYYFFITRPVMRRHQSCDRYLRDCQKPLDTIQQSPYRDLLAKATHDLEPIEQEFGSGQVVDSDKKIAAISTIVATSRTLEGHQSWLTTQRNNMTDNRPIYSGSGKEQGYLSRGERAKSAGVALTTALCVGGAGFTAVHFAMMIGQVAMMVAAISTAGVGVLVGLAIVGVVAGGVAAYRAATREIAEANQRVTTLESQVLMSRQTLTARIEAVRRAKDRCDELKAQVQQQESSQRPVSPSTSQSGQRPRANTRHSTGDLRGAHTLFGGSSATTSAVPLPPSQGAAAGVGSLAPA